MKLPQLPFLGQKHDTPIVPPKTEPKKEDPKPEAVKPMPPFGRKRTAGHK